MTFSVYIIDAFQVSKRRRLGEEKLTRRLVIRYDGRGSKWSAETFFCESSEQQVHPCCLKKQS